MIEAITFMRFINHRLDTLEEAREDERNKIADWFLKNNLRQLADDIRAKGHYK
jgi:hypothetical protein